MSTYPHALIKGDRWICRTAADTGPADSAISGITNDQRIPGCPAEMHIARPPCGMRIDSMGRSMIQSTFAVHQFDLPCDPRPGRRYFPLERQYFRNRGYIVFENPEPGRLTLDLTGGLIFLQGSFDTR